MLSKYTDEIKELLNWYTKAKELVIKVEGLDDKAYIQPLHELRYSYDHLMRAIAYEMDNAPGADTKVERAILSAKGHLVRAYSDCIEWLLVTVKAEYNRILQPQKMLFSFDEVTNILPSYPQIKENLQMLTDAVDKYKCNKKSEEDEDFDPTEELQNPLITQLRGDDGFFDGKYADLLRTYYDLIHNVEDKFLSRRRKKFTLATFKNVLLPIATGVIGGLIVYLITK